MAAMNAAAFRAALEDGRRQALPGLAWLLYDQAGLVSGRRSDLRAGDLTPGREACCAVSASSWRATPGVPKRRRRSCARPRSPTRGRCDRSRGSSAGSPTAGTRPRRSWPRRSSRGTSAPRGHSPTSSRAGRAGKADAERAYRLGIAAGDTGGYRNLGLLLQRSGAAWTKPKQRPQAQPCNTAILERYADLASVLLQLGRTDEATQFLRLAAAAGDELAQVRLALSLPEQEERWPSTARP